MLHPRSQKYSVKFKHMALCYYHSFLQSMCVFAAEGRVEMRALL